MTAYKKCVKLLKLDRNRAVQSFFHYVTMCYFCIQVPEQQQDQCAGARRSGPPGLHSTGPETEPKPHQSDPRESLPAPQAHPAVSTTGSRQFNSTVSALLTGAVLLICQNSSTSKNCICLTCKLKMNDTEEGVVVSVDRALCVQHLERY